MKDGEKHPNDHYGDLQKREENEAIPAATVVVLRSNGEQTETLMLKKSSKIAFGGMWVFPGGRIDAEDASPDGDLEASARRAATREAQEEAGIELQPSDLVWMAHWTPPPTTKKRFATWFFVGALSEGRDVTIDGGEILEHEWIGPPEALQRHARGEIDLAPPTWVTLYHLSQFAGIDHTLEHFARVDPQTYETHVAAREDGVRVALWAGDAGYDDWDADRPGARHRLTMARGGFRFEHPEGLYSAE